MNASKRYCEASPGQLWERRVRAPGHILPGALFCLSRSQGGCECKRTGRRPTTRLSVEGVPSCFWSSTRFADTECCVAAKTVHARRHDAGDRLPAPTFLSRCAQGSDLRVFLPVSPIYPQAIRACRFLGADAMPAVCRMRRRSLRPSSSPGAVLRLNLDSGNIALQLQWAMHCFHSHELFYPGNSNALQSSSVPSRSDR